ncbi:MAG: agmatine deiminase family protein [Magnetovibrio sp.]|nr:agmatine deiminase family protein [Magnetovibrio sp.]
MAVRTRRKFLLDTVSAAAMIPVGGSRVLAGRVGATYRMPAEWAPHERTLMQFVPPQNWRRGDYRAAVREWAAVANAVADFEPVTMVVRPEDRKRAARLLNSEIEFVEMPLNDGWSRDTGPIFVIGDDGSRRVRGFTFNGWGGKFPPFDADAEVKWRLAEAFAWPIDEIDFVLEGGAISVDGNGTLLTTEECLLHPSRNPGMGKSDQERLLRDALGVDTVIWLGQGIAPDPVTDGHVDGLCVFAGPGAVLLQTTDDPADENHVIGRDAKRRLQRARDAQGRRLEIIELPLADDVLHINFYICNGGVIVPIAGDPRQDDAPLSILRDVFPERRVVGVGGKVIAAGGGGVHCITQQVPAAG